MRRFIFRNTKLLWAGRLALIGGVVVLVSCLLAACSPTAETIDRIAVEVVDSLMSVNTIALDNVESELDSLDQELYAVEEKLLKLEQVVSPALAWVADEIENQKSRAEEGLAVRDIPVPPEEFAHLQNDQYWVTTLELLVEGVGTTDLEFSSVIKVTDLTAQTREHRLWEEVDSELRAQKSTLEQEWQTELDRAELSILTFMDVMDRWEDWNVERIDDGVYSISGLGLGWDQELTSGQWTYYQDSGEVIPADSQGEALEKILTVEF